MRSSPEGAQALEAGIDSEMHMFVRGTMGAVRTPPARFAAEYIAPSRSLPAQDPDEPDFVYARSTFTAQNLYSGILP